MATRDRNSLDDLPRIAVTEELRVGSLDDPDVGFSRIGSVRVEPGDTIWVSETSVPEIRVYAPDGRLVRKIGRRGDGPGEMRSLSGWGLQGDTVWMLDNFSQHRSVLFRRDGTVIRTVRTASIFVAGASPFSVTIAPVSLLPDGRYKGEMTSYGGPGMCDGLPERTVQVPHIIFDADGAPTDTTGHWPFTLSCANYGGQPRTIGGARVYGARPLPSHRLWHALNGDTISVLREVAATADSGAVTIIRTSAGDTVLQRVLSYRPRPVEAAFRDSVFGAQVDRYRERTTDLDGVARAVREMTTIPTFFPPVAAIHVGADGVIWLRRQPGSAEGWIWTRLDAEGIPQGEVLLPAGAMIEWSDGDRIHAVERDEFDVPWLVRYRVQVR